jgi:hypothetical protein
MNDYLKILMGHLGKMKEEDSPEGYYQDVLTNYMNAQNQGGEDSFQSFLSQLDPESLQQLQQGMSNGNTQDPNITYAKSQLNNLIKPRK